MNTVHFVFISIKKSPWFNSMGQLNVILLFIVHIKIIVIHCSISYFPVFVSFYIDIK